MKYNTMKKPQSTNIKKPRGYFYPGASLFIKEGGFLLSRIALQYHRRKWA